MKIPAGQHGTSRAANSNRATLRIKQIASSRAPARDSDRADQTGPSRTDLLQQQGRFDAFLERYNQERPHQALGMKVPADVYERSPRAYRGLEELTYPFHEHTITVTHCGRICFKGRKINLSHVFAGQNVGVTQVSDRVWLVTFMHYDLGYFDDEAIRLEPIENPFARRKCYLCLRNKPSPM